MITADFRINDQGSLVGFTPLSGAAQVFLEDQVEAESWQFLGSTLWVDHRMATGLIEALDVNGLSYGG
jgi:hypothetical protein